MRQIQIRPKAPLKVEKDRLVGKRITVDEMSTIHEIAKDRSANAREAGRANERIATGLSDFHIEVMGCMGELAVCKYIGVDWEPYVDRPDGGVDLTLKDGRTVDVKAAQKIGYRLLFKRVSAFKADLAVLAYCHPAKSTVYLAGWATREEFKAGHDNPYECNSSPAMKPSQLHSMDLLLPRRAVKT